MKGNTKGCFHRALSGLTKEYIGSWPKPVTSLLSINSCPFCLFIGKHTNHHLTNLILFMSRMLKAWISGFVLLVASHANLLADHIMGGEITYQYLGQGDAAGTHRYELTFNIYIDRNSRNFPSGVEPRIYFGIYDAGSHIRMRSLSANSITRNINPVLPANCNVPSLQNVKTTLNTYQRVVDLPYSAAGYYVMYERCCRNEVLNVRDNAEVGNTFFAFISSPDYPNSSPVFAEVALPFLCSRDTTVIANNASDPDGDRLEYRFQVPYTGGSALYPAPTPPVIYSFPPANVTYPSEYSLSQPFGANSLAVMDTRTGIARYAAPFLGLFAVAVEVREYRKLANNQEILVGIIRRELQFVVGDCQPNERPQFSAASTDTLEYTIRAGERLCFQVDALDTKDHLTVTASGDILDGTHQYTGPKASFTSIAHPSGTFSRLCWQTDCRTPPGKYTVTVKAVDDGCPPKTNTLIYTIEVLASPNLTAPTISAAGARELCEGKNLVLSIPAQNGSTYQWKRDGSNVGTNAPTLSVTQAGTYSLTLNNGCQSLESANTLSVTIRKKPEPLSISANGPVALCPGAGTELGITSPLSSPGLTYQWQKNQADIPGATQSFLAVSQTGSYRLMVTNFCGSTASNSVVIREIAQPGLPAVSQSFSRCGEGKLTLTVSASSPDSYRWYESATATTAIPGANSASFTTPALTKTRTYYVSSMKEKCESQRTLVTAAILDVPQADAGEDASIRLGERVALNASGGNEYRWTPALGLDRADVAAPVASPAQTTTYQVLVTSAEGCTNTDEVTVEVRQPLEIPDAFSPNNDGMNDTWEIANVTYYPNCRVEIFNRWGNRVYESVGYATPWNGTFRGETLPVTTYFYRIDLREGSPSVTGPVSIFK